MAERIKYPQIPTTVWWGVRAFLNRTPNTTLDDRALSIQLNVQPAAAKQYISELKSVGLIDEDGKATPLAHKWRLESTYAEAVKELMGRVYPDSLHDVAPDGTDDREKIVSWFQQDGLGIGAARNKAATYLLLSSPAPGESPTRSAGNSSRSEAKPVSPKPKNGMKIDQGLRGNGDSRASPRLNSTPLNVNLQIHISADAGTDQIEAIFSAMRRYLNDAKSD